MSTTAESRVILSSRVRLARNFADLPYRPKMTQQQADECIERVLNVLRDEPEQFRYFPMRGISDSQKQAFVEDHRISPDLFRSDDRGAALISEDGSTVIMVNEEDHLRIQAFCAGLSLEPAARSAFAVEEALERKLQFAFDSQWGYLTACPTNTGTGMRASVMLHLPYLTKGKNMGEVTQLAAKLGLTMRGMYGEGSEALGNVYQLSNQVTLGKTEDELIEAVTAVARQIAEMENANREKAAAREPADFEDEISRSFGLMLYARRMPLKEFYTNWSNLRVAGAMGMVDISCEECDAMLSKAQNAHLALAAGRELKGNETEIARSDMLRELLRDKKTAFLPPRTAS